MLPCKISGRELADKPGSVVDSHSSRAGVAACLKQPTRPQVRAAPTGAYSVLLRVGFTMPRLLPAARCALTAPFHPCRQPAKTGLRRRSSLCCTFRRLAPPRGYLALCPMEPGLSSPDALLKQHISGDCLACSLGSENTSAAPFSQGKNASIARFTTTSRVHP
ncbi:hypothetical protein LMG33810_001542 [Carnimonas sp. LMG 33810]